MRVRACQEGPQSNVDDDAQLRTAPLASVAYEGAGRAPFWNATPASMGMMDGATGKDESHGVGTRAPGPCERT